MDHMIRALSTALMVWAIVIMHKYLRTKTEKEAPLIDNEGKMVFRINKFYSIFGWGSIIFSAIIMILGIIFIRKVDRVFFTAAFSFIIFFGGGLYLVVAIRNEKLEVNNSIIRYYSFWGKAIEIEWYDIERVNFKRWELIFISENNKVKAHMHLNGFPKLIEFMKEKLDYTIYKDALSDMELFKRRMRF